MAEKQSCELAEGTRALLASVEALFQPSHAQRARVLAGLELELAAGVVVAPASTPVEARRGEP